MGFHKTLKQLRKMSKHVKKNKELETYFNEWFKNKFNCNNEQEILIQMQTNPSTIIEMAEHYETIKERYKWTPPQDIK